MGHNAHPEYVFSVMKMSEDEFIDLQKKLLEISIYVKLTEKSLWDCEKALEEHEDD